MSNDAYPTVNKMIKVFHANHSDKFCVTDTQIRFRSHEGAINFAVLFGQVSSKFSGFLKSITLLIY